MDNQSSSNGWLLAILKPLPLLGIFFGTITFALIISTGVVSLLFSPGGSSGMFACQPGGELNIATWNTQFENAGVFSGKGDMFIDAAETNQIDPVLLASIAFHETGRGTSKMVVDRNNPGGLFNSFTNSFFVYPSLEEGLDAMASNLYRLYISQGIVTIDAIGDKYAPIGVENDPNNLNIHWVPNVSKIIAQFGGLVYNCGLLDSESGFVSPLRVLNITSKFGYRVHPITGAFKLHAGIDFACTRGTPVFAAQSGTVSRSGFHSISGNYVRLNHGNNETQYFHLEERIVDEGDTVVQGQMIGTCGNTGASTGPHLHLELLVNGVAIDPYPYFINSGGDE